MKLIMAIFLFASLVLLGGGIVTLLTSFIHGHWIVGLLMIIASPVSFFVGVCAIPGK